MKSVFHSGRPARDGELRSGFDKNIHAPSTDWSFQTAAPFFRGSPGSFGKNQASFRAFRAFSNGFFNAEAKRADRIEAAIFALIVAISAWPIGQAAQAAWQLMK